MTFKEASDEVTRCVTLSEIAGALDRSDASIRRARLDPKSSSYRTPPPGWQRAIAGLARARAAELVELAEELEGG